MDYLSHYNVEVSSVVSNAFFGGGGGGGWGRGSGFHGVALPSTVSRSNWNLEMLVFVEGGKPKYPEKNPRSRDKNQRQTQPTYDAETGDLTRATLVGGKCFHHCGIPAVRVGGGRETRSFRFKRCLLLFQSNNQSEYTLSGSFTDPRPIRPTKEDILIDLSQLNDQFSSSPKNTSGVVLRNSGNSSNSRPSSLLLELETLEEDENSPSPTPTVRKNPQTLFDFNPAPNQEENSDGTISPLSEDLRERSVSVDTLKYEDPLSPTPTPSGEDLATASTEISEVQSNDKGNLINLSFANKKNAKASATLNLLGLKDALDDLDDEDDESSSLLKTPAKEKEELSASLAEQQPERFEGREDLLGSSCESDELNVNSLDSLGDLKMGQVICVGDKKTGRIRYIGPTDFAPGVWIGVELDTPSGKERVRLLFLDEMSKPRIYSWAS